MNTLQFDKCPACGGALYTAKVACENCKAEFPVTQPLSRYDTLSAPLCAFLDCFLKNQGNIKAVGEELGISYPTVKRRLDQLLNALDLTEKNQPEPVHLDPAAFGPVHQDSNIPSEIVRYKLFAAGGAVTIPLLDGKPCQVIANPEGNAFVSDKLSKKTFSMEYTVFDTIVQLLLNSKNYTAPKGNGHGKADKVGYGKCTEDTVMGAIAVKYFRKQYGKSTYDPVFVLAAVLDWAGIATNQRGYLTLTPAYLEKCHLRKTLLMQWLSQPPAYLCLLVRLCPAVRPQRI